LSKELNALNILLFYHDAPIALSLSCLHCKQKVVVVEQLVELLLFFIQQL
jgi:hypothetical protein